MRIAQVAPPPERVLPDQYGAAECVVWTLTDALVRRGHDVTLFAPAGTETLARLAPTDGLEARGGVPLRDTLPLWSRALNTLSRRLADFDLVHSHLDHLGFPLARLAPCPVVSTLHGRLDLPEIRSLYAEFADVPLVAVADSQRAAVPQANWLATVHHGVELEQFEFRPERGAYLAYLPHPGHDAGLDTAVRLARATGFPLKVGVRGPLDAPPLGRRANAALTGDLWVELVPAATTRQISALLGGALALVHPANPAESFGLPMIQALACGTPVVAASTDAAREIVADGITGSLCASEADMAHAVYQVARLNRAVCRAEAERRFSAEAMASRYEQVYARLAAEGPPARVRPLGEAALDTSLLTERQVEIARLVAQGYTNRQIARALRIKEGTVSNHMERIFQRLGIACRTQIAVWVYERGQHTPGVRV